MNGAEESILVVIVLGVQFDIKLRNLKICLRKYNINEILSFAVKILG